jgi:hypothetical protein
MLLVAAATSIALSACDVTQPDATPWQSTKSFSWPVGLGKRSLRFQNQSLDPSNATLARPDTLTFDMDAEATNELLYDGQPTYKLDQQGRSTKYFFLPLQDTLVIFDQVPVTLALVAPLVKDHSWNCAFDATNSATWSAKIVDRYSYRNVEGKVYKNVIEVEYSPLTKVDKDAGTSWVRLFAEGVGPVQTIKLFSSPITDPSLHAKSEPIERRILIDNSEAKN